MRYKILAWLTVSIAAVGTTTWALCGGDFWGGRTSNVTFGLQWCHGNFNSVTSIHHADHPSCGNKTLYAKPEQWQSGTPTGCSGTGTIVHGNSNSNTMAYYTKTCVLSPDTLNYAKGKHWDSDSSEATAYVSQSPTSLQCNSECEQQQCTEPETWDPIICDCVPPTPILLDIGGRGYSLTSVDQGVRFDLNADGVAERVAWTSRLAENGFLAFDRNGNHVVDDGSELFGNTTPLGLDVKGHTASNGFEALLALEEAYPGDVIDGVIDSRDRLYEALKVWVDASHDGVSGPEELYTLRSVGIRTLETDYRKSLRRDRFGNQFVFKAVAWQGEERLQGPTVPRSYFDVVLKASR